MFTFRIQMQEIYRTVKNQDAEDQSNLKSLNANPIVGSEILHP